jgi:hypothetical protein
MAGMVVSFKESRTSFFQKKLVKSNKKLYNKLLKTACGARGWAHEIMDGFIRP